MTPLIQSAGLVKKYVTGRNTVTAVDGVTLEIDPRAFVALVGRSGSGKSTLLNLVGGLDRPTGGELTVDGRRLGELSDDALARYRRETVGFVFQFFNLIPALDARRNVALPLLIAGVPRAERLRRSDALLELVGLSDRRTHAPAELSGGEQQRVAIARALVHDPKLLLADEPTGNLDTKTADEVLTLFNRLNDERGLTIVLVTHDLQVAAKHARRTIVLSDGKVRSDETR